MYLIEDAECSYLLCAGLVDRGITACVGYEDMTLAYSVAVSDTVADIRGKNAIKLSAVFLSNAHLSVLYTDAGLESEHGCSCSGNGRTTSTLIKKFKAITTAYFGKEIQNLKEKKKKRR